eukprot:829129-Pleurochrysis_carterae.AAC.1
MGAGRQIPRGLCSHPMRVLFSGTRPTTTHAPGAGRGDPTTQAVGPIHGQAQRAGGVHGQPRAGSRRRRSGVGCRDPGRLRRPGRGGMVA